MRAVHDDDVQFVEAVADAVSFALVLFGAGGGALFQQGLDLGLERRIAALEPLLGAISVEAMREANLAVDREDAKKLTPKAAAAELAAKIGR